MAEFVPNPAGIRELLKSPGVKANLEGRARRIAAAAGPGHTVDSQTGSNRARASVRTTTIGAMLSEATHRNLTRALSAGRG